MKQQDNNTTPPALKLTAMEKRIIKAMQEDEAERIISMDTKYYFKGKTIPFMQGLNLVFKTGLFFKSESDRKSKYYALTEKGKSITV